MSFFFVGCSIVGTDNAEVLGLEGLVRTLKLTFGVSFGENLSLDVLANDLAKGFIVGASNGQFDRAGGLECLAEVGLRGD